MRTLSEIRTPHEMVSELFCSAMSISLSASRTKKCWKWTYLTQSTKLSLTRPGKVLQTENIAPCHTPCSPFYLRLHEKDLMMSKCQSYWVTVQCINPYGKLFPQVNQHNSFTENKWFLFNDKQELSFIRKHIHIKPRIYLPVRK